MCHKYKEKRLADYESQKKNANKKISSNAFRIRIFLFFSYSFGIEVTNTSIRPRSSLENDTLFQKWVKCIPVFRPKKAQKPYSLGWHISIWLISESTPPPPSPTRGGEKSEGFLICHEKGYR